MQENRWKQMVKDNTHEPDRERERFPCICGTALNQKKKNILNVENEHGAIKNRGGWDEIMNSGNGQYTLY